MWFGDLGLRNSGVRFFQWENFVCWIKKYFFFIYVEVYLLGGLYNDNILKRLFQYLYVDGFERDQEEFKVEE